MDKLIELLTKNSYLKSTQKTALAEMVKAVSNIDSKSRRLYLEGLLDGLRCSRLISLEDELEINTLLETEGEEMALWKDVKTGCKCPICGEKLSAMQRAGFIVYTCGCEANFVCQYNPTPNPELELSHSLKDIDMKALSEIIEDMKRVILSKDE